MNGKEILIIGGTGTLGTALVLYLQQHYNTHGIRVFSRDEEKQRILREKLNAYKFNTHVSYLVGDVRDRKRLSIAASGVDIIINAAAMKQVPACEANPIEAVKTNIHGAENTVYAALENKVEKVMFISTDKAVYPINLYGCTKAVAEKLIIKANIYSKNSGDRRIPMFSCCRYGNVAGSRGSVIPIWKEQIQKGDAVTVTSFNMTRFWITLSSAVRFIVHSINAMAGGEIFIPLMPSFQTTDLLKAMIPNPDNYKVNKTGIRPGEKFDEHIITSQEAKQGHGILLLEESNGIFSPILNLQKRYNNLHLGMRSDNNPSFLTVNKLKELLKHDLHIKEL